MKMSMDHFFTLRTNTESFLCVHEDKVHGWLQMLDNDKRIKDRETRELFDVWYAVTGWMRDNGNIYAWMHYNPSPYNDAHIKTAMRQVMKHLGW